MKFSYLTIFLFAAALTVAFSCSGQEQGQGNSTQKAGKGMFQRGGGDGMMMGMGDGGAQDAIIGKILNNPQSISDLSFSDEQVKTLKASMADMRKQNEDFQKQLKEAGMEQAKLMTGDTVDEDAVMTAVEKAGKIKIDMAKARIKHMLVLKKTLTPAQTAKIKDMVQTHMKQLPGNGEMRNQKNKNEGEPWKEKKQKKHQQDDPSKPAGTGT